MCLLVREGCNIDAGQYLLARCLICGILVREGVILMLVNMGL